jgi:hypothetical protein
LSAAASTTEEVLATVKRLARTLRKLVGWAAFGSFLVLATSLLTFASFELFPALLDRAPLWSIRYFAIKSYVPDPTLVVRYRRTGYREEKSSFRGDLHRPFLGVEAPAIHQSRSYDARGFRVGSSQPPFEIVVIGDSYVEAGETDADTLAELLKTSSGRSVLNLGRSFYGPYQYVEVLKRYALPEAPKVALFCFFSGNDAADVREYERWLRERRYYFFEDLSRRHFAQRYWMALSDSANLARKGVAKGLEALSRPRGEIHPELAILRLGARSVTVRMAYWDHALPVDEMLERRPWVTLQMLLAEFQRVCARDGITPIVVFIPTKAQIYAPYVTPESGEQVLRKLSTQLRFGRSAAQGLARIAAELGLRLIDLTPRFERLAAEGRLLYHPFDTHWNREGREAAAELIAEELDWQSSAGDGAQLSAEPLLRNRRTSSGRSVARPRSSRTARAASIPEPSAVPVDATEGKVR